MFYEGFNTTVLLFRDPGFWGLVSNAKRSDMGIGIELEP